MFKKTSYLAAAGFFSFISVAESASSARPELSLYWNDAYQLLPISYEGVAEEVIVAAFEATEEDAGAGEAVAAPEEEEEETPEEGAA